MIDDSSWRRVLYILLAAVGWFWAVILGHIGFLLEPLLRVLWFPFAFPFRLIRYYRRSPVRHKDGVAVDGYGWPVVGYCAEKDRLLIVSGTHVKPGFSVKILPSAYYEYRDARIIAEAAKLLDSLGVARISMDTENVMNMAAEFSEDYSTAGRLLKIDTHSPRAEQCMEAFMSQLQDDLHDRSKSDEEDAATYIRHHQAAISSLVAWSRLRNGDPLRPEPQTTFQKILYKWWD